MSLRETAFTKEVIAFALKGNFDGFVAVGGGSSIDRASIDDLKQLFRDAMRYW